MIVRIISLALVFNTIASLRSAANDRPYAIHENKDCSSLYQYRDSDTFKQNKYNYRAKIEQLIDLTKTECYRNDRNIQKLINTFLSYYYSFINEDDSAKYYNELHLARTGGAESEPDVAIELKDIISSAYEADQQFFDSLVRETPIIMLNEAHHLSIHRDIARMFLCYLRSNGFKYFAVEGLWPAVGAKFNPVPGYRDGYYLQSRAYVNLILEAQKLGYQIIRYEDTTQGDFINREKRQAENIYRQTFERDPDAKVFVYCGYDHIKSDSGRVLHTAWFLKKLTGYTPLSFRQTRYYDHYFKEANPIGFDRVKNYYNNEKPFFVQVAGSNKSDFDVVIPNTSFKLFPGFNFSNHRMYTGSDVDNLLVFREHEYEQLGFNAIPVLNVRTAELEPNETSTLEKGAYTLIRLDSSYRVVDKRKIGY